MTTQRDAENPVAILQRDYWRDPTPERIAVYKTIGLSGGAICLAVLLSASQFPTKGLAAYVAIYAAVFGMPCWFYFGGLHDYYLLLGRDSYPHFISKETQTHLGRALLLGGLATAIALAGLAEYLAPYGSLLLVVVGTIACYKAMRFHVRLAQWWAARPSQGSRTEA